MAFRKVEHGEEARKALATLLARTVAHEREGREIAKEIIRLHDLGITDNLIGMWLGKTKQAIQSRRKRFDEGQ